MFLAVDVGELCFCERRLCRSAKSHSSAPTGRSISNRAATRHRSSRLASLDQLRRVSILRSNPDSPGPREAIFNGAPDRTFAVAVCVPLVLVVLILQSSPNFRLASGPEAEPFGGDVIQEWIGGWIVREGDRSRLYDLDYVRQLEHDPALVGFEWDRDAYLPMVYPPFWYLLASPLSRMPLTTAAVVWTLLMTACLVAAALVLRAGVRRSSVEVRSQEKFAAVRAESLLTWGLPLSLLFAPLIESLGSGQKSTLLLLLFAATYVLLDRRRPYWAGVVFGLVAFKPQLTLVIGLTMLLKRQWLFIAGGLTTGTVLVGLSFAVGRETCREFFELCAGMGDYVHTGGYDLHKAHCWWGASQLLLNGAPDGIVKSVAAAGSLMTVGVLVLIVRRNLPFGTPQFALQFSALTVATLLLSPHLFTYDLTLLLLPLFLIASTVANSTVINGRSRGRLSPKRHHQRNPSLLGRGSLERSPSDAADKSQPFRPSGRADRAMVVSAVALFTLSGLSPQIAAATGFQLTVPLMFALLWQTARAVSEPNQSQLMPQIPGHTEPSLPIPGQNG